MKNSLLLLTSLLGIMCVASCKGEKLPVQTLSILRQDGSTVTVNAEIADTEAERANGFMNREQIPFGTGMLFVFESDQILSFWMKNTPTPLSIAYIDSRGKIRNIFDMTPFSLTPVVGTVSCRYALEVPQGWFEKENICVGDTLDLSEFSKISY